ncbi:MAG TPA: hypothetical protein VFS43_34875 [Polyangiaceae bacterium]|nr:hypothetical protein [Polyangiaceae bacterium]
MSIDGPAKNDRGALPPVAGGPGRYLITQAPDRRAPPGPGPIRGRSGVPRPSPVYALGQLGYDRGGPAPASAPPRELEALLRYLDADPSRAAALSWTLEQAGAPVYALRPGGSLSAYAHERLYALLRAQVSGRLARVSVPGVVVGRTTLASGRLVPVLEPEPFGIYGWTAAPPAVETAVAGAQPLRREEPSDAAADLFGRVRVALANPGASPRERAINYAATEAFQTGSVYAAALHQGMHLDSVEALASAPGRPGADCWDVKLTFTRPASDRGRARMVYHFTVDVSEVVPVTLGKARSWDFS